MADLKLTLSPILKGMKLEVTVEEAVNDILLVCLNYGSTIYRGVLMDIKLRNLPSGISFPKMPQKPDPGGNISGNTPKPVNCETENTNIGISATSFRHSYNKDPVEFASKPLQLPSSSIIGRKTVRNITLRPRKTLCTNCKSNIHDTKMRHGHGHSKSLSQNHNARSPLSRSTRLHPNALSPPMHLRKRQLSTDDESPSKSPIQKKVGRLNLSPRLITNKSSFTSRATKPFSRCLAGRKKSTPAIKISIGGDSVLNIPPRISGNETSYKSDLSDSNRSIIKKELTVRLTDIAQQADQYAALKKVKKCVKKSKDKEEESAVPTNITQKGETDAKPFDPTKLTWHVSSHQKKHKRKHKHRHCSGESDKNNSNLCSNDIQETRSWLPEIQSPILDNFQMDSPAYKEYKAQSPVSSELKTESPRSQDFLEEISENYDEDNENNVPLSDEAVASRPRLVYTWKQNHGLSRVDTKFTGMKDYPLRSKEKETDKYLSPRNDGNVTSYSDGEESSVTERSDSEEMSESQTSDSDGFLSPELSASPDKNSDRFKPLMMKIQTNNVNKCVTTDGRKLHVNDIIWGKIQGFPWWPGRVMSITITKRDNGLIIAQLAHVAWFGSSTRSHMPCDEIFPFLEDFKVRYNKKKRGPYKLAIRQATMAARRTSGDGSLDTGIQHVDS